MTIEQRTITVLRQQQHAGRPPKQSIQESIHATATPVATRILSNKTKCSEIQSSSG